MNISVEDGKLTIDGKVYPFEGKNNISISGNDVYVNGIKIPPKTCSNEQGYYLVSGVEVTGNSQVNITISGNVGQFKVSGEKGAETVVNNYGCGDITNLTVDGGKFVSQHQLTVRGDVNANHVQQKDGDIIVSGDMITTGDIDVNDGNITVGGYFTARDIDAGNVIVNGNASFNGEAKIQHINECNF